MLSPVALRALKGLCTDRDMLAAYLVGKGRLNIRQYVIFSIFKSHQTIHSIVCGWLGKSFPFLPSASFFPFLPLLYISQTFTVNM